MASLQIGFEHPPYPDVQLIESIEDILNNETSLAMATINGNESYINTAYFAFNGALELFILSEPTTQHSVNLEDNLSVAAAIWKKSDIYGENLQGLQLFGTGERVKGLKMASALKCYAGRFTDFGQLIKQPQDFARGITASRLYMLRINKLKLLDEVRFGRRNYITLKIKR